MKDHPIAPEFKGITSWINSAPLTMESLRGSVVGIQFWSHSCKNCTVAMPQMQKIAQKFNPQGFTMIGIHSPELKDDFNTESVKKYLVQNHLTFPVAADHDLVMWNAYHNMYWPTLYLIDTLGRVREGHIGEGGYHRIEHDIRHLLEE